MITKLTKNPIFAILLTFVGLILLGIKIYYAQILITPTSFNPDSFINIATIENPIVLTIGLLLVASLSYLAFIAINNSHKFIEYSKAPFLLFLVVGFLIYPIENLYLTTYIAIFCYILALQILLRMYNQPSVMLEIFGASFLISISSILYYPSFIFFLLPFASIALLRPFDLRNYLILLIGFGLPFFYLFSLNYIFEFGVSFSPALLLDFETPSISFQPDLIPFFGFVIIAFLCFARILVSQSKFIVRQRNQLVIIYIFTLLLILVCFKSGVGNLLLFILLPFALFFNYLYKNSKRKWMLEVVLLLLYSSSFFLK